jgi:hypothetical protein
MFWSLYPNSICLDFQIDRKHNCEIHLSPPPVAASEADSEVAHSFDSEAYSISYLRNQREDLPVNYIRTYNDQGIGILGHMKPLIRVYNGSLIKRVCWEPKT